MKATQITEYEYCKQHLISIEQWKEKLPFGIQKYGCGSSQPPIEHTLEKIHREMYQDIRQRINDARDKIQGIINGI